MFLPTVDDEEESEIDEALPSDRSRRGEETGGETEDSEVVVVATPSSRPQSASNTNVSIPACAPSHFTCVHRLLICLQQPGDTVTVIVGQVSLNDDAPIMKNDKYKMLYIEYRFLGVPLEETETPYSLPKPAPYKEMSFNFTKGELDFHPCHLPLVPLFSYYFFLLQYST